MTLAELARLLNSRARRGRNLPAFLLLSDDARGADPEAAARRLPRGAAVLLRSYALGADARAALARRLARVCRARGLFLIVAGDAGLAAAVGAAGLHLPEGLARRGPSPLARLWRRRAGALLTVAAHSPAALRRAGGIGADAALLSPVFATASHPGARRLGPVRFALWCRAADVAVHALGGVRRGNVRRLMGAGAAGVATVGGS